MQHYQNNRETYDHINQQLEQVRTKFENTDQQTRTAMLRTAQRFAVLSIQTTVELHEDAFRELEGLEPKNKDPVKKLNYWKQKIRWINSLDQKTRELKQISELLLEGKIDEAHRLLIDEIKGVGAVKSAFMLAMLGYTSKICVDTHIQQIAGLEEVYSGVVIEKYEEQCNEILEKYDRLKAELNPFMVQWILFDMDRGNISMHEPFFKAIKKK